MQTLNQPPLQTHEPASRAPAGHDPAAAERRDVAIVGGGISGLALAAWLTRTGVDCVVLERAERAGGVIDGFEEGGFRFERGPNTVLTRHAGLETLLEWTGLAERALRVPLRGQARHIWLRGRLHTAPAGPGAFLRSSLLPAAAKLALLREPFAARGPEDESVADFVRRRLGADWLRNLVAPLVSGIWAGDPERLSVRHSFPQLKQLEREHGSLLRGGLARLRAGRGQAAQGARPPRVMLSFPEGLAELPRALAARLGTRWRGGTELTALEPLTAGGYALHTRATDDPPDGATGRIEARRVILTTPARATAALLEGLAAHLPPGQPEALRTAAAALRGMPHASLAIASVGIDAAAAHVPQGFGFLVPRGEGLRMLGAIAPSNFLPGRAPQGGAGLSVFVGGELDPEACTLGDAELETLVRRELGVAIGLRGAPRVLRVQRWREALPQYDLRHGERLAAFEAAEAALPGLHLTGNWRGGTALAERVEQARQLAERLATAAGVAAEFDSELSLQR